MRHAYKSVRGWVSFVQCPNARPFTSVRFLPQVSVPLPPSSLPLGALSFSFSPPPSSFRAFCITNCHCPGPFPSCPPSPRHCGSFQPMTSPWPCSCICLYPTDECSHPTSASSFSVALSVPFFLEKCQDFTFPKAAQSVLCRCSSFLNVWSVLGYSVASRF